ncbi:MAG: hypothetical protein JSW00_14585 [Thermoplasmata archaeon]|nr:MAG: hypothetical protein JSW00_14585 [Thermoplasmata archaeon]
MARKCPHCKARLGTLATSCWKCKSPVDYYKSQSKEVDHKEIEEPRNIGKLVIVPYVMVTILAIILVLIIAVGGGIISTYSSSIYGHNSIRIII